MRIFIPDDVPISLSLKELFILVRPFRDTYTWNNNNLNLQKWGIDINEVCYEQNISNASIMILPLPINWYVANEIKKLDFYSKLCSDYGIKAIGFISGDLGIAYPEFYNITYFRMGGFRSQLSDRNQGFPVSLSDHFRKIYNLELIEFREKQERPVIGFCGHASSSWWKGGKESLKFIWENVKRALDNPLRSDWEPIFPSAFHRSKLLNLLSNCERVKTNFILRDQYRAGAKSLPDRDKTTREYYENIRTSDYVLCVRGGGNFSVRFYETLMMGRIPVFINTDCLIPFQQKIPWKDHVVWIEWKDRNKIDTIVSAFHQRLSSDQFRNLQLKNRELWLNTLSVKGIFELLN